MASALASEWSIFDRFIQDSRFRQILPLVPYGSVIADIGCGTGEFLERIADRINYGYGVDPNLDQTVIGERYVLLKADAENRIPIASESVDIVTALAVVEHISNPMRLFEEVHRVLKPGGKFVLTTPSPFARPLLEFLAYRLEIISRKDILDHKRYFAPADIELFAASYSDIWHRRFQMGLNQLFRITK